MTLEAFLTEWNSENDCVLVHTSGSTGKPKPMRVEKRRMLASARITCDFLGLKPGDVALLCMPIDFIAGKMMVVRALERGMQLVSIPPDGHPLASVNRYIDFAAMVPMQVFNSLQIPAEREKLMRIKNLIIGGGAIDHDLEKQLSDFPNAVWSTYGMTETLSHIALRRLSGPDASTWYTPFEQVNISLNDDGCLVIDAPMVCENVLTTNDIAEIRADGRSFRIIGRKDNVVCSGGIKIQIEEVERLLKPHLTVPFMITKRKDEKFGEAIVMLYVPKEGGQPVDNVCRRVLPKYWQPRCFIAVEHLPMTQTGKPARREAEIIAREWNP
ncbi:MAG: AMP-binding protein [Prevotella sp.]|nr:AMP-binding protein [Prevotella sp.]